jgi:hypothetical protein
VWDVFSGFGWWGLTMVVVIHPVRRSAWDVFSGFGW